MKILFYSFYGSIIFVLALAGCSPQNPTQQASKPPLTHAPGVTGASTSTLQTVNLAGPEAGTVMQWADGSQLVFVPAGDFQMGAGGTDNPEHTVTQSDYWIQQTEVTNQEYALCVKLGQCDPPKDAQAAQNISDPNLQNDPVVGVDWQQAQTYCGWIKGDLPTEAQWEKAARGPDGNIYPWGKAAPGVKLLNFNNNIGGVSDVTAYPDGASHYQVLDMAGNVYEWVKDWYQADYYKSAPPTDPSGPDSGEQRSVRGSSFSSGADQVPSATRFHSPPDKFRQDLGFRCVVKQPPKLAFYCQSSPYAPSGGSTTTGGGGCSPKVTSTAVGCDKGVGHGSADVGGGRIVSVNTVSPDSAHCLVFGGTRIYCNGAPGTTIQARVSVSCGGPTTSSGSSGPTAHVLCPGGVPCPTPTPGGTGSGSSGTSCGDGLTCAAGWTCVPNFKGSPACFPPSGSSSSSSGACPTGMEERPPGSGRCVGVLRTGPSGGSEVGGCPSGSYSDSSGHCVMGSGPYTPGSECLAGFTFDGTNGCCSAPDPGSYPGCAPGEALSLIVPGGATGGGVVPLTVSRCTTAGSSGGSLTVSLNTGACPDVSGGGKPGGGTCPLSAKTCAAQNKKFDASSCTCR